jgi:hypothetical protein
MKIFKEVILRVLVASLLVGSMLPLFETGKAAGDDAAIIINHTSTDITQIPQAAIEAAKSGTNSLHIGYGHTSHGSQLIASMKQLVEFANNGGKGLDLPEDIFAYNNGGTDGALDLDESYYYDPYPPELKFLQGTCGLYPQFVDETHEYLNSDNHSDVNVIMWSWCREVDTKYRADTIYSEYLTPMSQLEADYPNVKFVYMTGTLSVSHDSAQYGTSYIYEHILAANQVIRDYCIANGKILYDFADIEAWDPDGNYYPFADEACNYYADAKKETTPTGNWATAWQDSHPRNVDWYSCNPQHTLPLNGNLKAYAAWWLFARLAGWEGTDNPPADTQPPSVTVISPNGGEKRKVDCQYDVTWTATDDVGVASCNISYSTDNGASYTDIATGQANDGIYSWTVSTPASATCLVKVGASDAAGNWGQDESDAVFSIYGSIPGDANNDCVVDALDITGTERIILGLDSPTEDADANQDTFVNALDITEIEGIII